jgi:hypothetical protein
MDKYKKIYDMNVLPTLSNGIMKYKIIFKNLFRLFLFLLWSKDIWEIFSLEVEPQVFFETNIKNFLNSKSFETKVTRYRVSNTNHSGIDVSDSMTGLEIVSAYLNNIPLFLTFFLIISTLLLLFVNKLGTAKEILTKKGKILFSLFFGVGVLNLLLSYFMKKISDDKTPKFIQNPVCIVYTLSKFTFPILSTCFFYDPFYESLFVEIKE